MRVLQTTAFARTINFDSGDHILTERKVIKTFLNSGEMLLFRLDFRLLYQLAWRVTFKVNPAQKKPFVRILVEKSPQRFFNRIGGDLWGLQPGERSDLSNFEGLFGRLQKGAEGQKVPSGSLKFQSKWDESM